MNLRAYDELYLSKASRVLGNMLHIAVYEYHMYGGEFLKKFMLSGIAERFEEGNPKYIAGMSGVELFWKLCGILAEKPTMLVLSRTTDEVMHTG